MGRWSSELLCSDDYRDQEIKLYKICGYGNDDGFPEVISPQKLDNITKLPKEVEFVECNEMRIMHVYIIVAHILNSGAKLPPYWKESCLKVIEDDLKWMRKEYGEDVEYEDTVARTLCRFRTDVSNYPQEGGAPVRNPGPVTGYYKKPTDILADPASVFNLSDWSSDEERAE